VPYFLGWKRKFGRGRVLNSTNLVRSGYHNLYLVYSQNSMYARSTFTPLKLDFLCLTCGILRVWPRAGRVAERRSCGLPSGLPPRFASCTARMVSTSAKPICAVDCFNGLHETCMRQLISPACSSGVPETCPILSVNAEVGPGRAFNRFIFYVVK
jgi:hypothetical protein